MLDAKIATLRSKVQYYGGLAGLATHVGRKAMSSELMGSNFRLFLVVLTEPKPPLAVTQKAATHTFRFAELKDFERLAEDKQTGIAARDVESFRQGNRCLLQLNGDELVGYTWYSPSPLIELQWGLHFNLPDDMVYNYNGFTAPKYRGIAYQSLRHLKLLEHLAPLGKRRLMGYVSHLNYKSLQGVAKSGYQRVGVLRGVKRGGKFHFSLNIDEKAWATIARAGPLQFT